MSEYLNDFVKKNNIDENFIIKNKGTFCLVEESRKLCENCQGLFTCRQKSIGDRLILEYDGALITSLEHCSYKINKKALDDVKNAYLYTDIADKFYGLDLTNIPLVDDNIKQLCARCLRILKHETKKGLYVIGDMGVGKTYMMMALANSLVKNNESVCFIKFDSFVNDMRMIVSVNDGKYQKIINTIKKCDYLFVDDVGSESVTTFSRDDILFNVLNYRLDNELTTCFTSNYDLKSLEDYYSFEKNGKQSSMQARRLLERIDILTDSFVLIGHNKRR